MGSTTSTSLQHIRLYSKYGLYDPLWDLQPLQALLVYGTNGTTVTMASTGHYRFYSLLPFYHIFLSLLMYETNPNDKSLHLVIPLLSLAERKMLCTMPMTLVHIAIRHPCTRIHMPKFRICIRNRQRSSNRGQAPSEFARRARQ